MAALSDISHLYKYRSLAGEASKWVCETLVANSVRFASVRDFNDPSDCRPIYSLEGTPTERKRYLSGMVARQSRYKPRNVRRQLIKNAMNASERQSDDYISQAMRRRIEEEAGVYCLSEDAENILMWGHYADCHRGVVLRFKATAETPFFGAAQRVSYSASRPIVNPVKQSRDEQLQAGVLSKAVDWAYEKEWRIIDHDNGPGLRTFSPHLLDGVIFGACIEPSTEAVIREAVSKRSTPLDLFKARLDGMSYRLQIEQC